MGYFMLEGSFKKLAPIAQEIGSLNFDYLDIPADKVKWNKRFTPSRRKVRQLTSNGDAKPMRPYDRGQGNDRSKAIEYAQWLAKRDGIDVGGYTHTHVNFSSVEQEGFKAFTTRAHSVIFHRGRLAQPIATINIPYVHYDPTRMPAEMIDES